MRYGTKRSYGSKYKSTGIPMIDEIESIKRELENVVNQVWDVRFGQKRLSDATGREFDSGVYELSDAVDAYKQFLLALNKLEKCVDDIDIDEMVQSYNDQLYQDAYGANRSLRSKRSSIGFNKRRRY